jgi:hypothetical protein
MDDHLKVYTLEQFWQVATLPDGLYAVWVNKLIYDSKLGVLNGIKGSIVTFSEKSGFGNDLNWTYDFNEKDIMVKFLDYLKLEV